jgi:anion-transporting  ArsA/GET3 family ATPase
MSASPPDAGDPGTNGSGAPASTFADLLQRSSIIICAGPGGVGKTTTAAAIALEGARAGRRTCVVTIDPARRLADALGIAELGNEPHRVPQERLGGTEAWPGELWALMLDTKATFDAVVVANAADDKQAQAILDNRFYRNISGALSGTQEYMATEKLFGLHHDDRFDLIVVDTPPTRHALDFLDAPNRLLRFLNNRFFRVLMTPTRTGLRAVGVATRVLLRTISGVVGGEVVRDAIGFFTAFEGMEQGFRDRAGRMEELLGEEGTAFVVVAAPRRDAVDEATFFADRLRDTSTPAAALVMNRVQPRFGPAPGAAGATPGEAGASGDPGLDALLTNMAELDGMVEREEHHIAALAARLPGTPVVRVPMLVGEVHDLEGLAAVAEALRAGGA